MTRLLSVVVLLLAVPAFAAPVPKVVLSAEQKAEFDRLWAKAGKGYDRPAAVAFTCRALVQPEAATEFLKAKLQPFARAEAEVKRLIAKLDSETEAEWRSAFDELRVYDVRLTMSAPEAWELAKSDRQKNRLGLIWQLQAIAPMGRSGEKCEQKLADSSFALEAPQGGVTAWRVVSKAIDQSSMTCELPPTLTKLFERDAEALDRARVRLGLQVLEQIGTAEAKAVIRRMATGHEEAGATKDATGIEARLSANPVAESPVVSAMRLLDGWQHLEGPINVPAGVARSLRERARVLAFLKGKLRPFRLDKTDAKRLLVELFSEKPEVWGPAFDTLRKTDLRLAFPVEELWEKANTADQRVRLKWLLCGEVAPYDLYRDYHLRTEMDGSSTPVLWSEVRPGVAKSELPADFAAGHGYSVADQVSDIHHWYREESAIYILDAIGSDDAIAIIKDMATGHPDAGPTKAAKDVLKRRGAK